MPWNAFAPALASIISAQGPVEPRSQCGHRGIAPAQEVGTRVPPSDVATAEARVLRFLGKNERLQVPIHRVGIRYPKTADESREMPG